MGKKKRYCSKGHDTWSVGRDKNSSCKECERQRHERRMNNPITKMKRQTIQRIRYLERKLFK